MLVLVLLIVGLSGFSYWAFGLSTLNPPPLPSSSSAPSISPPPPVASEALIPGGAEPVGQVVRDYVWWYGSKKYTWKLQIPESLYVYYQQRQRPPTENYSIYVTHPMDDAYVDNLVEVLMNTAGQNSFDEIETIEFMASFVQSLPYTDDKVTTPIDEYPRYPVETLVDIGGDCEDTSILLASLLRSAGYGAVLVMFEHHCAVGVRLSGNINGAAYEYKGEKYYYIETTNPGWKLGRVPEEHRNSAAKIYSTDPAAILTHDWTASINNGIVTLKVEIKNIGSLKATDVSISAGFDAGEEKLANQRRSELFEVLPDEATTVTMILRAPPDQRTRLIIQVIDDGFDVDRSYSESFDT